MKMQPYVNFIASVIGKYHLANFPVFVADADVWSLRSFKNLAAILQLEV